MPRIFVPIDNFPNIHGSDAHYVKDVLRCGVEDEITILDGSGKVFRAKIAEIGKDIVKCQIIEEIINDTEPHTKITLAQALPKSKKMDLIVEKCTELGVSKIIPMLTERCISRDINLERINKIAKSSAQQSGRAIIPEISPLTNFQEVIKLKNTYDLALIPWELEKKTTLKDLLKKSKQPKNILVLIGPEGGFSQTEIKLGTNAGFFTVSLGNRILRTETAGISILSSILYEFE
ncbi:MAG: RsmE family RNA methyltransferase [Candidatus Margulisiibacteriota bacterium]|jgi:16S rRNA (uracil1498-N3)-methyltransferase